MVTDYCFDDSVLMPARLSKVAITRAHQKYEALFSIIGPAQINVTMDLPFLHSVKPTVLHTGKRTDDAHILERYGSILICPLLMGPRWDLDHDTVLRGLGTLYEFEDAEMIKGRDYALLNELKWFLVWKYSTDLDWEGCDDEARTLAMLKGFATLLRFCFNENNAELIALEQETFPTTDPEEKCGYVTSVIQELFDPNQMPEMDDLLKEVWASMVNAANKDRGETNTRVPGPGGKFFRPAPATVPLFKL